jgi:leucyl-tRNA synthetase
VTTLAVATFNTAIAAIMELLNAVNRFDDASPAGRSVVGEALDAIVLLLSPIVPHIAHELWNHWAQYAAHL